MFYGLSPVLLPPKALNGPTPRPCQHLHPGPVVHPGPGHPIPSKPRTPLTPSPTSRLPERSPDAGGWRRPNSLPPSRRAANKVLWAVFSSHQEVLFVY